MRFVVLFAPFCLTTTVAASSPPPTAAPRVTAAATQLKIVNNKAATAFLAGTVVLVAASLPAVAEQDVTHGQQRFQADCAARHAKVEKVPGDQTSLNRQALDKYRNLDAKEIKTFVQEEFPHKFMPFGYANQDYQDVSAYILEKELYSQTP